LLFLIQQLTGNNKVILQHFMQPFVIPGLKTQLFFSTSIELSRSPLTTYADKPVMCFLHNSPFDSLLKFLFNKITPYKLRATSFFKKSFFLSV